MEDRIKEAVEIARKKVAAAFKAERKRRGLTQKQVVEKSGVSLTTVGDVERNDYDEVYYSTICRLAAFYDLKLRDIL